MQTFVFEKQQVRAMVMDGEPWFVGKDVAEVLGYTNPQKALRDHVDDEDKTVNELFTVNGTKGVLINESGLYSLILSSKMPGVKQFKRWVTSEVLPGIRKNGGYIANQEEMSPEELMAKALQVAQKTLAEREARLAAMTAENQMMKPKAEYFDALVDRNLLTSIRETAKELGVREKVLIQFLMQKRYLYRDQKGRLMPYADKNKGLFELKECYCEKSQWKGTQTMVTPKGRETFRLLCAAAGLCGGV